MSCSTASGRGAPTRDLVAALVVPYAAHLARRRGRDYLRIVAQLSARSAAGATGTRHRTLPARDPRHPRGPATELPVAVRRERVVEMIMLMTVAMAERARVIDSRAARRSSTR